jgi:selenophosphate synthase
MMLGSDTSAELEVGRAPLLPGVIELATAGVIPGGTRDNLAYTERYTEYSETVSMVTRLILNDAQTSGGLLISVPAERTERLLNLRQQRQVHDAIVIGKVGSPEDKKILVSA